MPVRQAISQSTGAGIRKRSDPEQPRAGRSATMDTNLAFLGKCVVSFQEKEKKPARPVERIILQAPVHCRLASKNGNGKALSRSTKRH